MEARALPSPVLPDPGAASPAAAHHCGTAYGADSVLLLQRARSGRSGSRGIVEGIPFDVSPDASPGKWTTWSQMKMALPRRADAASQETAQPMDRCDPVDIDVRVGGDVDDDMHARHAGRAAGIVRTLAGVDAAKRGRVESAALHLKIVEQEALIAALRKKLVDAREETAGERDERQRMERCCAKIKQMVEGKAAWWDSHKRELTATIDRLRADNERLSSEAADESTGLTLKLSDMQAAERAHADEKDRLSSTIESLELQVMELKQSVLERSTANKTLVASLNAADERARGQIAQASRAHAAAVNELKQELQRQADIAAQLRESSEAVNRSRQQLKDTIDQMKAEHTAALAEKDAFIKTRDDQIADLEKAAASRAGHDQQVAHRHNLVVKEKESVIAGLSTAVAKWEGQYADVVADRDARVREMQALEDKVKTADKRAAKAERDHLVLRADIQRENDTLKEQVRKLLEDAEVKEDGFRALLEAKETQMLALADDVQVLRELLPAHAVSDVQAQELYARETLLRETLSGSLSDVAHLTALLQHLERHGSVDRGPTLCNPETSAEQAARTRGMSLQQLAAHTQHAMDGLVDSVRGCVAARSAAAMRETQERRRQARSRSPQLDAGELGLRASQDDCAVQ